MGTANELPGQELTDDESSAAESVAQDLVEGQSKVRRVPPLIGSVDEPPIGILTDVQIDEAMFG